MLHLLKDLVARQLKMLNRLHEENQRGTERALHFFLITFFAEKFYQTTLHRRLAVR
jgi:hypothetical protein